MFDWINDVTEGHDGQLFLTNDGQSFLGKLGEKDFSSTGSGEKINDDFKHGQGSDKTSLWFLLFSFSIHCIKGVLQVMVNCVIEKDPGLVGEVFRRD